MNTKISIITAVLNGESLLPRLIESVKKQSYPYKEFIIIDGGSNDGTVEIIKKFESTITYWVSESDKGIYDAWNKGTEKATGEWIMFLGCDDILLPNALEKYISFIRSLQDAKDLDLIHSKVKVVDKKGRTIRVKGWEFKWPLFLKEMTIEHPGALHARNFFFKYGMYNTSYKIVGDYELLLRPGRCLKTAFMNEVTVDVREGGVSDSTKAIKEHFKAVTTTGKYPLYKALFNALVVTIKFKIKGIARSMGVSLYLKKA